MNQNTPPSLNLTGFFELGSLPIWEKGTGEFESTAIAGTILLAGYGGDEVVTIVVTPCWEGGEFKVPGVMVRNTLGKRLREYKFKCANLEGAQQRINLMLARWFTDREPRPDHAIEANPLKRV